jgi:UDP-N-acetylmuramoyl-L-alanyl-D-glutamate--2,6-diaminopimelate ligase
VPAEQAPAEAAPAEAAAPVSALRPRQPPRIALSALLGNLSSGPATADIGRGAGELWVSGITADSRLVCQGDLYVALPGAARHGADFTAGAVAAGAVAVLTDPLGEQRLNSAGGSGSEALGVPVLTVPDPRRLLGPLAAAVYGHPSRDPLTFGITGTNGKTTTSYLLEAALRSSGLSTGLVGTLGFSLDGQLLPAPRTTITTPEASELQSVLAVLAERGAAALVLEVSSHALALSRVDGITFDVAAFTNFGQDHLEFHGDVESYFEAKAALFTAARARRAVINVDDPRGRQLMDRIRSAGGLDARSVSLHRDAADYAVTSTAPTADGRLAVSARTPERDVDFTLDLPGSFNVRNALTALAMADLAGVDLTRAAPGLAHAAVPGRMQRVTLDPPGPAVVVDFAHTPQAVSAVLEALRHVTQHDDTRRVVVLGCGGDRDPDKRRPMGAAAVAGAEVVVVTDDNPRSEEPEAIRAEILRGAHAEQQRQRQDLGREVAVVDGGDRRTAIEVGLTRAGRRDVVAVLGKGHEAGQELAGSVLPFDDVDVVRTVWAELTRPSGGGRSRVGDHP